MNINTYYKFLQRTYYIFDQCIEVALEEFNQHYQVKLVLLCNNGKITVIAVVNR